MLSRGRPTSCASTTTRTCPTAVRRTTTSSISTTGSRRRRKPSSTPAPGPDLAMPERVYSSCDVPGGGRLEGFAGPQLRLDDELVTGFEAIDRSDFYDPRGGPAVAFSIAVTSTAWFVAVH